MLLSRGAVVFSSALVARAFGSDSFALFMYVSLTATALSNIAMLGMMNGLPRFCARLDVDPSNNTLSQALIAAGVVIIGLTTAVGAVIILPPNLIGLPDASAAGSLAALTCIIGLTNLFTGINNGLGRYAHISMSSIVMCSILVGGTFFAILLDKPAWPLGIYLLATLVALQILAPSIIRRFIATYRHYGLALNTINIHAVGSYLGPMLLSTMLTNTGLWIAGRTLIGGTAGASGYAEFALGMQWFGLAQLASNVISRAIMPSLMRNSMAGHKEEQRRTLRDAAIISVLCATVVLLLVLLFSPIILSFYGTELSDSKDTLILFVLAAVVAAPITIFASNLIVEGRYKEVFWSTAIWWSFLVSGSLSSLLPASAKAVSGLVVASYALYFASILVSISCGSRLRRPD